ncbi:MAG: NAD-dependent epimerase/dehydratase family protein [Rubrobacteraceae bacterium]
MADRVLITGATGFVGSHIAEAFVAAGYTVRCGLRATSNPRWISSLPVEHTLLDFDRPADLLEALKGVEIVVHAAGITRARYSQDYDRVNAEGTRRLAEAAREVGVERFVQISSLAARGPDGHDHPASAYGRSKLEAEKLLRDLDGPMQTVVLRPAAVYGPRDTDLLPLFKMASRGCLTLPAGPGSLQPVYAADVAKAVLAAADKPEGFGPFPLAERSSYSWREVAGKLEEALGRPVRVARLPTAGFRLAGRAAELAAKPFGSVPVFDERRAEDLTVHTWTCDPSITERELDWRAGVPLSEGLARTARWYREEGWL